MIKPTLKKYLSGQVIFKENLPGDTAFIIKEGEVELSVERGAKKVVLTSLKDGSCFGEMAIISKSKRSATAIATQPTSVYILDTDMFNIEISKAGVLAQGIIRTLMKSIRHLSDEVAKNTSIANPKISIANILNLQAHASVTSNDTKIVLPYLKSIQLISEITGLTPFQSADELKEMSDLGLINIQTKKAQSQLSNLGLTKKTKSRDDENILTVEPHDLISKTKSACRLLEKKIDSPTNAEHILLSTEDIAKQFNVEIEKVYQKISQQKLPGSLFYFRKDEIISYIEKQGQDFFTRIDIKKIEDFDSLSDIQFVDRKTLSEVFSEIGHLQIAHLIVFFEDDGRIKQRILSCFSERIRGIINELIDCIDFDSIDDVEMLQLEAKVIHEIKNTGL